jgi:hypothetical protein
MVVTKAHDLLSNVPSMNVRTLTPYVSSSHTPAPASSANKAHSSKLGVELSIIEPTAGAPGVLLFALERVGVR